MRQKKIHQTHNFNWYVVLWILALIIILYLTKNWYISKKFIGIVERKSHLIGAQESGRVQNMLIAIGDQVKKDQVVAMLDVSDLKTTLEQLGKELSSMQRLQTAQRDRYSIDIHRAVLQLENEASDLTERLSLIESKSAALRALNAEIERLKNAEKAGLGHSRDLSDLIWQRDGLASYLKEQSKNLNSQTEKLETARRSRQILENADIDSMTKSLLIEQMERAELLRREIAATEHRIGLRTIVSPCDGFITEILVHLGDAVDAFVPIFTIEELKPSYLDVFIPEQSSLQLEPGMKVEIYSSRNHKYNTTGTITFVHPGFTQASERLSFRGQIFWARKVRVELPQDHHLLPGEVVNIRVQANDRHKKSAAIASENMANPHNSKHPLLANMQIPKILMEKTRFEPSGVAWLPDINKYLIVSDDTGIHDSQNDHAAWLFLMDAAGRVDSSPVPLIGITTVNDLEAIAPAGDETFYLVSSQNISKKNRRPGNRELIIKVKREGEKFVVTCQVQFLSLLLDSYSWPELKALGLTQFDKDGKPILNIEGATFYDEALYLGLKEPVSDTGAIIWKLTEVDRIFDGYTLRSNQLSVYGYAKLGQHKNTTTGISDLMFDQNGRMWALSTIVDAGNNDQLGGFFRIDRFADGRLEATCLYSFPGLKPEGICQPNPERFLIIFDKDNDNPEFCYFDVEKL